MNQKSKAMDFRAELKALSNQVKGLVGERPYKSINQALFCEFYRKDGHQIFKSMADWHKEGKAVIKDSKPFVIWSAPETVTPQEGDPFDYFPLRFLFSNLQVEALAA